MLCNGSERFYFPIKYTMRVHLFLPAYDV